MPTHGIPNPTLRLGALVLNANLSPAVLVDDEVQSPIRKIRLDGRVASVWASDLVEVDTEEFELALACREAERIVESRGRGRRNRYDVEVSPLTSIQHSAG